jgi:GNAT superfamily N-acetyltransferase
MSDPRVETLAAAFYDDPLTEFLFPLKKSRLRRLSIATKFVLGLSPHKSHFALEEQECVAVIGAAPPGRYPVPFLNSLPLLAKLVFKLLLSGVPFRVMDQCLRIFSRIEKAHLREPHWYVQILGVHPNHQGKGIGGKLLQPVLQQADEEGVAVYLESSNPRNLDFYRKHGFEVMEEITPVDGCPRIRTLLRKPVLDPGTR